MVRLLEGPIVQSWAETNLRYKYSTDDHLRAFVQARKPIPIGSQCILHLASKHDIRDLVGAELLLVGQWERGDAASIARASWVGLCIVASPDGLLTMRSFKGSTLAYVAQCLGREADIRPINASSCSRRSLTRLLPGFGVGVGRSAARAPGLRRGVRGALATTSNRRMGSCELSPRPLFHEYGPIPSHWPGGERTRHSRVDYGLYSTLREHSKLAHCHSHWPLAANQTA